MARFEHHSSDNWKGLGHFLEGLVFPARPVDMIRHAQQQRHQERVHEDIVQRLQELPDRKFRSAEEVRSQLGEDRH